MVMIMNGGRPARGTQPIAGRRVVVATLGIGAGLATGIAVALLSGSAARADSTPPSAPPVTTLDAAGRLAHGALRTPGIIARAARPAAPAASAHRPPTATRSRRTAPRTTRDV